MLINKSKVKESANVDGKQLNVAEEFYDALEQKNKELIQKACARAKANSRSTVMARDL
jgi:histone H3/H4